MTGDEGFFADLVWSRPLWVITDQDTNFLYSKVRGTDAQILFVFPNKALAETAIGGAVLVDQPGREKALLRLTVKQFALGLETLLERYLLDVLSVEGVFYPITKKGVDALPVAWIEYMWQDYQELRRVLFNAPQQASMSPAASVRLMLRSVCFKHMRQQIGFFDGVALRSISDGKGAVHYDPEVHGGLSAINSDTTDHGLG